MINGKTKRRVSSTLASFYLLSMLGCASRTSDTNFDYRLVGLWSENSENVKSVVLRKSDGTYLEKKLQKYDSAKPAISYLQKGHWSVKNNHYWFGIDYISAAHWKSYIGKSWDVEVLEITASSFKYISTDGATVEQKKIGKPLDEAFERTNVGERDSDR